ncbi:MAG: voltage-gated potassium channel [Solirubrobacteraceae bacterium]|nr:voltage-gated potassium channel [Solirubrobacteraceae bacterium]
MSRASLRWALPGAGLLVLLAGGGFAAVETDTVMSYWEGVWWALSLMTTVGFVGGSPETTAGQVLSAVLMVLGFLLLAVTTAAVASLFVSEDEAPQDARDREFEREALDELRALNSRLERLERRLDADA